MASYTIEDIELIRRKSGISYQEAVSLLDYHNGNIARALVDLERNGRIKEDASSVDQETPAGHAGTGNRGKASASNQNNFTSEKTGKAGKSAKNKFVDLISKLFRTRIKVNRGSLPIANLSALFGIVAAIISPHLMILAAVVVLLLGYKVSLSREDPDFASANMEKMVRSAADNVRSSVDDIKSSVSDFARGFQEGASDTKAEDPQDDPAEERSFFRDAPAAKPNYHSVPTINVPVQVESQDGSVTVETDNDGFTSATVK